MQYDSDGNLTASIDADGDTTQYLYDAAGNQTADIDPDGNTTTMAYDPAGNLTKTISPTGGTTLQSYDGDGNLTETIDPDGNTTVTSYDADDRETQQIWYNSSGTPVDTLAWTYDADGNMLSASNSNGTYTFAYDNDGRLTNVQEPYGVSLSYSYDGDGNQTQVVDSFGGTQTSIYDLADQLVTREYIGEGEELRIDFTYNAEGQIATQTDYSNLAGTDLVSVTDTEYDADGNVVDIHSYNSSDATIDHFAYTYNAAGNLAQEVDVQNSVTTTTCYDYDPAGQLISANSTAYAYDANGNPNNTGDTVGAGNQLTSDGTYNYTYDANGNEITKTNIATGDTWTFGYNNANEMVSAVETNSSDAVEQSICYSYDVFGNLIAEEATIGCTTAITKFAVDGWNPAEAGAIGNSNFNVWAGLNCSGSLTSRYVYGDDVAQPLARIDVGVGNTTDWLLTDHLGSIRTVINNCGTVADSITYDAYGNITSETDPSERGLFGYAASFTDSATGLDRENARWYDPFKAQWVSQDPIGFASGTTDLYGYVGNDPTGYLDPSGLTPDDVRPPAPLPGWHWATNGRYVQDGPNWFFIPNNPRQLGIPQGSRIPIVNGVPDFRARAQAVPTADRRRTETTFRVTGLNGSGADMGRIEAAVAQRLGLPSATAAREWMRDHQLVPHHLNVDGDIQLVPQALHNGVRHSGGAALLRNRAELRMRVMSATMSIAAIAAPTIIDIVRNGEITPAQDLTGAGPYGQGHIVSGAGDLCNLPGAIVQIQQQGGYRASWDINIAARANITVDTQAALRNVYGMTGIQGLIADLAILNRGELTPMPPRTIRQNWTPRLLEMFGVGPWWREVTIPNPPNLINPTYATLDIDPVVLQRLLDLDVNWNDIEMSILTRSNGMSDLERSRALASIDIIKQQLEQRRQGAVGGTSEGGDWGGTDDLDDELAAAEVNDLINEARESAGRGLRRNEPGSQGNFIAPLGRLND